MKILVCTESGQPLIFLSYDRLKSYEQERWLRNYPEGIVPVKVFQVRKAISVVDDM